MVLKEAGRFHCRQHRLRFGGQRQTLFVTFKRGKRGNVLPGGHGWPHKAFGGVAPLVRGGPSCRRRKGGGGFILNLLDGIQQRKGVCGGGDLQSTDFVGTRGLEPGGPGVGCRANRRLATCCVH
jgi:hypothetical protein